MSPKVKTTEGEGIGVCSLVHNTSGIKGHAEAPRWGLRKLTSKSITHTGLHKPNNKVVSASLEHFGIRTSHGQTRIYNTHHGPDLGEAITFHLMVYSMLST